MADARATFDEYWDGYLRAHASPRLRRVHLVAASAALGCVAAALVTRRAALLLAAPVVFALPTWLARRTEGAGDLPPSPSPVLHAARAAFEMWRRALDGSLDDEFARVNVPAEREKKAARRAARRREAETSPATNMMTDNTVH